VAQASERGVAELVEEVVEDFFPRFFSTCWRLHSLFAIMGTRSWRNPTTILPRVAKAAPAYRSAKDRPGPRTRAFCLP
jgi:hypothetical protein